MSAVCASGRERRVAAGEDESELVVAHRSHLLVGLVGVVQQQGLRVAGLAGGLAADAVDRPVAGGGDDPGARVRRAAPPTSSSPPRTRPARPPRRARCRRGGVSGWRRSGRTRPGRRWSGPWGPVRRARRRAGPRSAPRRPPRHFSAQARAASRSSTSMTQNPRELLLRLDEGPVGHRGGAVLHPDHGGAVVGQQAPGEHPDPLRLHLVVDGPDPGEGGLCSSASVGAPPLWSSSTLIR